jgi:hypothetical protein
MSLSNCDVKKLIFGSNKEKIVGSTPYLQAQKLTLMEESPNCQLGQFAKRMRGMYADRALVTL